MPSVPLFHFAPQGSGSSGVRASVHLLDAKYEGGKALGAGIANLADPIAKAAESLQNAQDFRQQTELDSIMRDAWTEFQGQLNPSTDETKWAESWRKRLDEAAKSPIANASPRSKPRLVSLLAGFKSQTSYDVTMQAKAAGVKKTTDAAEYRLDQAWKEQDEAGAEMILGSMADLGLIRREAVPGMMEQGRVAMQRQQAIAAIQADPIAANEALTAKTEGGRWKNWAKLDEDTRLSLVNHSRYQSTALRTATFNELLDGLNSGEVKSVPELQALVDRRLITPQQMKSYRAAYGHGRVNTDAAEIGQLMSDCTNYSPTEDPHFTQKAALLGRIATSGYPQNVQQMANALLRKKQDSTDRLNGPVAKDVFQRAKQEYDAGLFLPWHEVNTKVSGSGLFGSDVGARRETVLAQPDANELRDWQKNLPKKDRDAAALAYASYLDKMRAFIDANPNATAVQAEEHSQTLKRPYVIAAASAALTRPSTPAIPQPAIARLKADPKLAADFDAKFGAGETAKVLGNQSSAAKEITTKAEFDALRPGEAFIWKGRRGVKNAAPAVSR